ncbi:hypothetical protein MtrunA17_Chr1g0207011 [Medicago truncatula]|uniref:Uncharacterized protein n=1 Tax=Medicago truncatula TaxID=3880 RepID=A0A072VQE3_MEDTR|nr:protein SOB FIVE-LIKE 5 isoform X2 [Medicago truncatula]KEH44012.1 hypothetical protein MTR_1g106080 [Medicago truncatula]RHN82176.1 hypothetical protein MtrunA17_Chr1g0207011 [Medicago truncatula]
MNMSAFDSECSSGCESGWTLYLEHSYEDTRFIGGTEGYYGNQHKDKRVTNEYSEEGVEDLSMVSDASSGPPHLPYDDDVYFNEKDNVVKKHKKGTKKQKVRENKQHAIAVEDQQHLPSFLHDTASSHVFDFSTNNVVGTNQQNYVGNMVDYSQGFSATNNYFEGKSSYQEEKFGFLQPPLSKNDLQGNNWYGGKNQFY